jgi:hypothetical protein
MSEAITSTVGTTTAAVDVTPAVGPVIKRKYREFEVSSETFSKFSKGRARFERWSKFLNLQDENEKGVYDYALKNRDSCIVLKNSENGAMCAIRRRALNE